MANAQGLLKGSFRPQEAICALRTLRRHHGNLIEERSKSVQWIQKSLDQMNVQVHHAVTDITGVTGMDIIRSIVAGERNPAKLAQHRDHRCKKPLEEITEHLIGNWREEHLFNLASALRLYDHLQEQLAAYERQIQKKLEALQPPERKDESVPPHPNKRKEDAIRRKNEQAPREALYRFAGVDLLRIDGIGIGSTEVILTEIGPDIAAFPTEADFVSWLRLAPYTPSSGGKRLKTKRNARGATRVSAVLRMAALSLKNSKTALGATYRRLAGRKDAGVAVFAVATGASLSWSTVCFATARITSMRASKATKPVFKSVGYSDSRRPLLRLASSWSPRNPSTPLLRSSRGRLPSASVYKGFTALMLSCARLTIS
jgi:transposase